MDFFIIENGQQTGPLTIAQLAEKKITAETLVWREGMADWQPAWKVQELRYILEENRQQSQDGGSINPNSTTQGPAVPPIPPTYPKEANDSWNETTSQGPNGKQPHPAPHKSYLVWKILGGLFILLLIVMTLTNPSKETHQNAIRSEVSKAIDKSTNGEKDIFTQGFKMIARMMAGSILDSALDQLFEYHNYFIYSKGTITLDGKEHTISYGLFGKVFTLNADDMIKAIEQDEMKAEESESSSTQDDNTDVSTSESDSESDVEATESETSDGSLQDKLEDKANKAVDKIVDKASKKVEEKINKKLDEVTDSSTIEKLVDKIIGLF